MKSTEEAFHWIVDILETHNIEYKISGGLAARAHGSTRELADIDIVVNEALPSEALEGVRQYIHYGPAVYQDKQWDISLVTLVHKGQEIDIVSGGKIFNKQKGSWEPLPSSTQNVYMTKLFSRDVPVEPLDILIAYKKKLARPVDLEDVRQLKASSGKKGGAH